jgi:hypothetical protein
MKRNKNISLWSASLMLTIFVLKFCLSANAAQHDKFLQEEVLLSESYPTIDGSLLSVHSCNVPAASLISGNNNGQNFAHKIGYGSVTSSGYQNLIYSFRFNDDVAHLVQPLQRHVAICVFRI